MKASWTVEFLNNAVETEFLVTPKDLQARLVRITDLIESHGLENLGMPYVRHLQDKLWEIRGKGQSGIARARYVAVVDRRVVIYLGSLLRKRKKSRREKSPWRCHIWGRLTMGRKMSDVKKELLQNDEFKAAYVSLEDEFALAGQLIEARKKAHLTQDEVSKRMGTTQSVVARLESGHPLPSLRSLKRYALAVCSKVEIRVVERISDAPERNAHLLR